MERALLKISIGALLVILEKPYAFRRTVPDYEYHYGADAFRLTNPTWREA